MAPWGPRYLLVLLGNTKGFLLSRVFRGGVGKELGGLFWYFHSGYFLTGLGVPFGLGGRPPGQGRLFGGRGLFLGVEGGVTSRGGAKLGSSSTGGCSEEGGEGFLVLGEVGAVVILPSLISLRSRSMKGSVETGFSGGFVPEVGLA